MFGLHLNNYFSYILALSVSTSLISSLDIVDTLVSEGDGCFDEIHTITRKKYPRIDSIDALIVSTALLEDHLQSVYSHGSYPTKEDQKVYVVLQEFYDAAIARIVTAIEYTLSYMPGAKDESVQLKETVARICSRQAAAHTNYCYMKKPVFDYLLFLYAMATKQKTTPSAIEGINTLLKNASAAAIEWALRQSNRQEHEAINALCNSLITQCALYCEWHLEHMPRNGESSFKRGIAWCFASVPVAVLPLGAAYLAHSTTTCFTEQDSKLPHIAAGMVLTAYGVWWKMELDKQ